MEKNANRENKWDQWLSKVTFRVYLTSAVLIFRWWYDCSSPFLHSGKLGHKSKVRKNGFMKTKMKIEKWPNFPKSTILWHYRVNRLWREINEPHSTCFSVNAVFMRHQLTRKTLQRQLAAHLLPPHRVSETPLTSFLIERLREPNFGMLRFSAIRNWVANKAINQ